MHDALSDGMIHPDREQQSSDETGDTRLEYSEPSNREDGRASARFNTSVSSEKDGSRINGDDWEGLLGGCSTAEGF